MTGNILCDKLKLSAVGIVATFGIASSTLAQPYNDSSSYSLGELTVRVPRDHVERSWNGAPIVWASTSRTVNVSDLDLTTPWGVHALYERVGQAAWDACEALDNGPGLTPADDYSDIDCQHRAVIDAMSRAPMPRAVGYGY